MAKISIPVRFLQGMALPGLFSIENSWGGSSVIENQVADPVAHQDVLEGNKADYRKLCEIETSIPIFSRAWWLDAAVGPDGWDVAIAKNDDRIVGAMPYAFARRYGMSVLKQPALSMSLGPWLLPLDGKPATRLASEKKIMQSLIDQLPAFDHFIQNWHSSVTNWLPFYWNGFSQTTHYTYVIPDLTSVNNVWNGFENSARASCKKASERFKMTVRDDLPLDTFIALHRKTLQRRGVVSQYSDDYIRRMDAACAKRNCRKFVVAVNEAGQPCAANYIVWDENSAYGLMNGVDPEMRNTGVASLCMWEIIKHAAKVTKKFDFFGSMNETIEPFVRSFGAQQVPFFVISKTPSRLLRLRRGLQLVMSSM